MDIERFRRLPLLGILRDIVPRDVAPLAEAALNAGLEAIEITMNTTGAAALIRRMADASKGRLMLGAGTVLTVEDLAAALDAGATFIVMPTLVPEVVERCVAAAIPVFPGALTPQEIFSAWRAGATMVKVFPASCFGPGYFREVKGPFREVELLAVGGVNAENVPTYFAAGASGVAFAASVFRKEWLAAGRYDRIRDEIRQLVDVCRTSRPLRSEIR